MTSAAQNDGESSASTATINPSREGQNRGLVNESFYRILDILRQLGLYRNSPKIFMIYAHENESANFKAHQNTVKNYISWFKKILFNVDSDRSPHGYGLLQKVVHPGASVNIVNNQICLLPTNWHKGNVDYVLVFYSQLLARYMKDEREFKDCDETYSRAIFNICTKYEAKHPVPVGEVCEEIRTVQKRYSDKMGPLFHHVLTETALLSFRNQGPAIDSTLPIILSERDEKWEPELIWEPKYVYTTKTQIRIDSESKKEYQQFFKILLMFEPLEIHRRPIEGMRKCFDRCFEVLEHLKGDVQPEKYRNQVEVFINEALRYLSDQWQMMEGPITPGHIRDRLNLYSKLDVQSILRVSGERLPNNLDDIELAVAERRTSGQDLNDLNTVVAGVLNPRGEGPRKRQQEGGEIVPLYNLFDKRIVGGESIRPQRIFIRGKPGIGKTTLCRRLMYEYSWHASLRNKFDLVVRIPVRKLEYSADLNNLLFEEYFQAISEGRDLSKKLGGLILDHENFNLESKNASSLNILIILDGLDEARRWSHERRALLEKLMGRPTVIITSSSQDTDMLHVSVDLNLEALGLSTMSVDAYLENTEIVPSDTATGIHRFTETKPSIKDMVRVPILLDILCYSWDELHGQSTPARLPTNEIETISTTMSTLYKAVVRSLWRKDIPVLGKLDYGEPVTVELVNTVGDSARLERLVDTESNVLEEVAHQLMSSNRLEFTNKDITEAIRRLESNGDLLPLSSERNLQKLSLLRSYYSERQKKYRFVHYTFQEFFAARFLALHLARDSTSFETILKKHKYNRRYEVVWMFLAGLLMKVEELDLFFNLLDEEPRDLVGVQHIHIFMYCLSECHARVRPSRWIEYQRRLVDWFRLEHRIDKSHGISSSITFPENILREQLAEMDVPLSQAFLLSQIADRNFLSESIIQDINQRVANNRSSLWSVVVRRNHIFKCPKKCDFVTLWAIRQGLKLPDATVSDLLEQIRLDTDERYDATLIFGRQRHLPEFAIKEMIEWLKDPRLSKLAYEILGNQATLSNEVINCVIGNSIYPFSVESWDESDGTTFYARQDLHPEAITKVWEILENAARRNWKIPDRVLMDITRMYPIQAEDVEKFGNFLQEGGSAGLQEFAVMVLGRQGSLPKNILSVLVDLLRGEQRTLFGKVQKILQEQTDLPPDIIDEVRALFVEDKHKLVVVLEEYLQLPDEAYKWLMAQIIEGDDEDRGVVDYLLGQSDLPDFIVNSLPDLVDKGVGFKKVAELLRQQTKANEEDLSYLVRRTSCDLYSLSEEIVDQRAFANPSMKALEQAQNAKEAWNARFMLQGINLDQESIQCLESLMNQKPTTELAIEKSKIAFLILCEQVMLDLKNSRLLHDAAFKCRFLVYTLGAMRVVPHQLVEYTYANLQLFDFGGISDILSFSITRSIEDLLPVYINGDILYYYAVNGNLIEQRLEDEEAFRTRFRKAQAWRDIPEWAMIKLPHPLAEHRSRGVKSTYQAGLRSSRWRMDLWRLGRKKAHPLAI